MAQQGVEILDSDEIRIRRRNRGRRLDRVRDASTALGHNFQGDLPLHLESEVDRIANRVAELLDSGWRRVRVVTDHGWLLMPGWLAEGGTAGILDGNEVGALCCCEGPAEAAVPTYAWHWNRSVRIVSPPGIACFRAGEKYAHGGVSLQECVVPDIVVERGVEIVRAAIQSIQWRGMRCRVRRGDQRPVVEGRPSDELEAGSRRSIVAAVKAVGPAGEVSLAVADDKHEGAAASVVLLDAGGKVVDSPDHQRGRNG